MLSMLEKDTVAVIDVGSNSIKLLVARKGSESKSLEKVFSQTFETRISAGISHQNHELAEDAMLAGSQSIAILVDLARSYEPKAIKIVATSAVRDARNAEQFVNRVYNETGVKIDVLTGIEEATFIGRGLRCDPLIEDMEHFIQMDIGGGSLELIRLSKDSIKKVCSLQLGAVRLTEKLVLDRNLPIAPETEMKIKNHVLQAVEASGFRFEPATDPMIVTGGAFSVIRSILAARSDGMIQNGSPVIYKSDIAELKKTLCELPLYKRKNMPGLPEPRADVMPTALITIDTVLEHADRDTVTQSSYNLRYGIAAELLARP